MTCKGEAGDGVHREESKDLKEGGTAGEMKGEGERKKMWMIQGPVLSTRR